MTFKRFHCWDCGARIVEATNGGYATLPACREVKFGLSDGSYMQSPFCMECAERPWPRERLIDFKVAADRASGYRPVDIVRVEEILTSPVRISGVL